MSESPPRGAERDLYRDTWVRYLGESGARGTATPPPHSYAKRVSGRQSGSWRRWEDLSSHSARARDSSERARDLPQVTQLWLAQPALEVSAGLVSQVEARTLLGGTG